MDLQLTDEQKLAALHAAEAGIQSEIFSMLLRMGVDPDTYDPDAGQATIDPAFSGERTRVNSLISSLDMIRNKIQSLS
jgi:hypothetical protein